MLLSYLKIAYRNLVRNPVYSTINIFGLALGISCCLLLSLYVQDEMSYDKHHNRLEDIYRVSTISQTNTGTQKLKTTSPPVAPALLAEIPEVESAVRVLNPGISQNLMQYKDKLFYETDGCLADSTLFDVLTYPLMEGNPAKALTEPNSVVISDKLAQKLFGQESALNKQINISQIGPAYLFSVTGVFSSNNKTHINANFFISMTSEGRAEYIARNPAVVNDWVGNNFVPAFVKLIHGHDRKVVEAKMNELFQRHGGKDMKALGVHKTLVLEPVKDFYLKSDSNAYASNSAGQSPKIMYVYMIASIGVFILLIACINFVNLSTAKATKRAGEIGIRKVMGALRSTLISQIMSEAVLIVLISILVSIIIAQLALPYFNLLTGKTISFGAGNIFFFIVALGAIALVTGLAAGSYPAFYLSSFQPAQVLKGKVKMGGTSWIRRSLVIFQFMIAIALVCGMLIITRQLNFMQEMNLGFDSQAKLILPLQTASAQSNYDGLKKELQRIGAVTMVSGTRYVPGRTIYGGRPYYAEGGSMESAIEVRRNKVDFGYIELLGIKLISGTSFLGNQYTAEGERNVIINETCAKMFGIDPNEFVGQNIYSENEGEQVSLKVIGVMEDIHQTSLKEKVSPTFFYVPQTVYAPEGGQYFDYIIANVETNDFKKTIGEIETTWKQLVNDTPFEYSFLDETIQAQYDDDRKVSGIISSFTFIALFISCLGLYGLSSFMTERRFKEIGVRKVLGASVKQIAFMMSSEFVKLVIVAFFLAAPMAWYVMNRWLEGFANKAPLDITIFILAGLGALVIALLTVSFESIRAANTNPVESLKVE